MDVAIAILIGTLAGLASGMAGIGGGVIMVPAMVLLLSLSQTTAQGTSLLAILFTSVAGTIVNVRNDHVDLRAAALLGLGGVAAAQLGKSAALAVDVVLLQRMFGGLVLFSGLRMLFKVWRARRDPDSSGPDA